MANGGASRIAPLVGLNEAEARRAADRARETIRDLRDEVDFTEAVAEALAARTFAAGVKAGLAATMREVAPERTAQVVIPPEAAATALETALREITEQVEAMRRAEETAPPALPSGD
jgi:hypothetical protein